jgi:ribonucleoside-diphosphate reductase beta chain
MNILTPRATYSPMLYPKAHQYWELQQSVHWLPNEIPLGQDVNDYKINLSESEQNVIAEILKSFTTTEIFVEDYWTNMVANKFKQPEIQRMATAFAAMESIHQVAYAKINEELELDDFNAFLQDPESNAKIENITNVKYKSKEDLALSLAIFSAFTEGVNLFSSFAVLMSFQKRNLMKGVGKIVEWSSRDEALHSEAGCWLFRELIKEFPEVVTDEFKQKVNEAARTSVSLEDKFLDKVFMKGDIEGITKAEVKNYIRYRANSKLKELGFGALWKNVDQDLLNNMAWFDVIATGVVSQDFFSAREAGYFKGLKFNNVWE